MKAVHRHILLLAGLLSTLLLFACQQETTSQQAGHIEANQAYEDHFGSPPIPQRGYAFARVGYLPVRGETDQVGAIPLYLYDQQNQLQQILNRLTGGEIVLPQQSRLYQPFPDDLEVMVGPLEKGAQTIALTTAQSLGASDRSGLVVAVAETALQFPEISEVHVVLNGEPVESSPDGGYRHRSERIVVVDPPAVIMIAGMWEDGAEFSEEILINFDRPVKVNQFGLYDHSGQRIQGEYFTSVFDMAVVVHPERPEDYPAGIELRAVWEITDALGRSNAGEDTLPLRRFDH